MNILLPIICCIYAFIFYVFFLYDTGISDSLLPSPLFNSFIYIAIGVFFIVSFSNYFSSSQPLEIKEKKDIGYYKELLKKIFFSYSHYLSYIFFYIGVFFIAKLLPGVYFSYCLFFTNIFVIFFFIAFRNTNFSFDFLRINQIIFSLIYIYSYVYILMTGNNFFGLIDFINSFLVITSFVGSMFLSNKLKRDSFFIGNFYLYLYVFILFYTSFVFKNNYIFLCVVNVVISFIVLHLADKKTLKLLNPKNMRAFGLFAGYIGTIVGIAYLVQFGENILIYLALTATIIMNFLFHNKYQNYISLLFSVVAFSALIFVPSFGNIDGAYNFIFVIYFSFFLILSTYFFEKKHDHDHYFIHGLSYIYNAIGVILFLLYYSPSLIQIALLMFVEFFYLFLSYYKLNMDKKNNGYLLKK